MAIMEEAADVETTTMTVVATEVGLKVLLDLHLGVAMEAMEVSAVDVEEVRYRNK